MRLYNFVKEDFISPYDELSKVLEKLTPPERQEVWKKLEIFLRGLFM